MEAASVFSKGSPSVIRSSQSFLTSVPRCCCSSSLLLLNPLASSRGFNHILSVGKTSSRKGKRRIVMRWGGGPDKDSGAEERPETLFMRELAKRKKLGQDLGIKEADTKTKDEETETRKPKVTDERETTDQRKRSMALNSEGLDGLVPRGQELVKLGGSFWLSLWPLILASLLAFAAAYLYFGSAFVHLGYRSSPPPYVDPYELLDSEQLPPKVGPNRVPYNTYQSPN